MRKCGSFAPRWSRLGAPPGSRATVWGALAPFIRFFLLLWLTLACSATSAFAANWTTRQSQPIALWGSAFAVAGGKLYTFGGRDGAGPYSNSYVYDPGTNAWNPLAAMPGVRYSGNGAAVINGKIYVAGGWTTSPPLPNNNLWEYDIATNTWATKASMPTLSACGATEVINGKLYVTTACNGYISSVSNAWEFNFARTGVQ